jgi:hypothetical protein
MSSIFLFTWNLGRIFYVGSLTKRKGEGGKEGEKKRRGRTT